MMKKIRWNEEKNESLKKEWGASFEVVSEKIVNGDIVDDIYHPNNAKYEDQRIFVIDIENYIFSTLCW